MAEMYLFGALGKNPQLGIYKAMILIARYKLIAEGTFTVV
jgi:hypothetical protein